VKVTLEKNGSSHSSLLTSAGLCSYTVGTNSYCAGRTGDSAYEPFSIVPSDLQSSGVVTLSPTDTSAKVYTKMVDHLHDSTSLFSTAMDCYHNALAPGDSGFSTVAASLTAYASSTVVLRHPSTCTRYPCRKGVTTWGGGTCPANCHAPSDLYFTAGLPITQAVTYSTPYRDYYNNCHAWNTVVTPYCPTGAVYDPATAKCRLCDSWRGYHASRVGTAPALSSSTACKYCPPGTYFDNLNNVCIVCNAPAFSLGSDLGCTHTCSGCSNSTLGVPINTALYNDANFDPVSYHPIKHIMAPAVPDSLFAGVADLIDVSSFPAQCSGGLFLYPQTAPPHAAYDHSEFRALYVDSNGMIAFQGTETSALHSAALRYAPDYWQGVSAGAAPNPSAATSSAAFIAPFGFEYKASGHIESRVFLQQQAAVLDYLLFRPATAAPFPCDADHNGFVFVLSDATGSYAEAQLAVCPDASVGWAYLKTTYVAAAAANPQTSVSVHSSEPVYNAVTHQTALTPLAVQFLRLPLGKARDSNCTTAAFGSIYIQTAAPFRIVVCTSAGWTALKYAHE
jgi:hypothetical protein